MDIKELVILAIETLKGNITRTILTMLGIIIGIASVIIIISLAQGATESIVGEISSFGANIVTVMPGRGRRGPGGGGGTVETLTRDDGQALRAVNNVVAVSATANINKQFTNLGITENISITGVEYDYGEIQSLEFTQGTYFDPGHIDTLSKVLLLGDENVEELYGENTEVVGETIKVDGKNFRIIGVVKDFDGALMPISTVMKLLTSQNFVNTIEVGIATGIEDTTTIEEQITNVLLIRHDIIDPNLADFSIRSASEILDTVSTVTSTLTIMLASIAAISLLVGGIGIMNIMLVTVTERTKEIGLLKAIGAKRKNILTQFLIESVVMTLFGGAIGLLIGIGISYIAASVIGIPFVVSTSSVLLAVGVSCGVGIVFGWYPARRAAGLQPVDALRYE